MKTAGGLALAVVLTLSACSTGSTGQDSGTTGAQVTGTGATTASGSTSVPTTAGTSGTAETTGTTGATGQPSTSTGLPGTGTPSATGGVTTPGAPGTPTVPGGGAQLPVTTAPFERTRALADYQAVIAAVAAIDRAPITGPQASAQLQALADRFTALIATGSPDGVDGPSYYARLYSLQLFTAAAAREAASGSPQATNRYALLRQETGTLLSLVSPALGTTLTLPVPGAPGGATPGTPGATTTPGATGLPGGTSTTGPNGILGSTSTTSSARAGI
ncbi:hypothetical protein [Terracoccus luteus]|uniref:hypothetical protein n=1 Tax=Terracoccus luteus TaxID=53356 RepID=UPI000EAE392B|nr:hypothetical protein [Terracoccus luteus]